MGGIIRKNHNIFKCTRHKVLLNHVSLDMEYNFGTETRSGSNNETNLRVSSSCETMCAALSFRVGLPLSPLRGIKKETIWRPRNRNQYLYVRSIGPGC